jgi:hypothetical protein
MGFGQGHGCGETGTKIRPIHVHVSAPIIGGGEVLQNPAVAEQGIVDWGWPVERRRKVLLIPRWR